MFLSNATNSHGNRRAFLKGALATAGGYAIAEVFYLAFKGRYGNGAGGIVCLPVGRRRRRVLLRHELHD